MADNCITQLDPIPPNSNPFNYDPFHMGIRLDKELVWMYSDHDSNRYAILIHTPSGKRIRIDLDCLFKS